MAQNDLGAPVYVVNSGASPITTSTASTSPGGAAANPSFSRSVGSPTAATNQAATSVSPATSTLIVPARAGRQSVVISNITGTQPVYFTATAVTTGVTTGFFLAGTAGATVSIGSAAAIYGTSPTAAQTLSYWENY